MPRTVLLFSLGWVAFAVAPGLAEARGRDEVHQSSDDVRVTVGVDGVATVQHHLRYRIVAGHFKTFDFAGVDPRAELMAASTILPEKGGEVPARVELDRATPGTVRITHDEPRGLGRGVYVVDVKYRLDLVAMKLLVRDGAMWRLSWTAPPSPEGHDGARVVFAIPPAPTEPRLASPEQAATTLATLRREPEKDELELVRAHVPRGEAVTWSARVDPKAFPAVTSLELRPPGAAASAAVPLPNQVPRVLVACAFALLAGALALALRAKQGIVVRACQARLVRARALLPMPRAAAPFVYGAATAGALAMLLWGTPAYGAALVVLAMAVAAHRSPLAVARPRGPGLWRAIPDGEVLVRQALSPEPGDALDIGTRAGKISALVATLVLGLLAYALRTRLAGAAIAIPLVGAALVPLLATGTRAQLPRAPAEGAARILGPARDALGRLVDLAHIDVRCMARFGEGTRTFDEVRLACLPNDRMPGLRLIELALASREPLAIAALPEVLVRFDDGSPAAAKIAKLAPGIRIVPGRSAEEKVLRLSPRVPTPSGAARLLARLARDLEGKRSSDREPVAAHPRRAACAFTGIERRITLRGRAAACT